MVITENDFTDSKTNEYEVTLKFYEINLKVLKLRLKINNSPALSPFQY